MNGRARLAALGTLAAVGAAAVLVVGLHDEADSQELETIPSRPPPVPQVPRVEPLPPGPPAGRPPATCQVFIESNPPEGAQRVGTLDVPAQDTGDPLADPESRRQACQLLATHAVTEQSYVDSRGQARWRVGLYRAGEGGPAVGGSGQENPRPPLPPAQPESGPDDFPGAPERGLPDRYPLD